jgi:arsenical pump membrane protein
MPSLLMHILLFAIVAISILLMLVRPRNISEAWWVGSGALLLVLLHLIPIKLAGRAIMSGSDVYLFLIGMMLLSELGRQYGLFDWISSKAVHSSQGKCSRLFLLIYGVGILTTIFMSNDATAVVLTPAVLATVRKSKVHPMPYLFTCAMIANAASFVLPISNPANLVVFQMGMPSLSQWLMAFGIPSLFSITATFIVLRFYFRSELSADIRRDSEQEVPLLLPGKLVLCGLAFVVAVLLTASAFNEHLGLPACLAALLVMITVSIWHKSNPFQLIKEISWATLFLVAALFVLVGAVESTGSLRYTQAALVWCKSLSPLVGTTIAAFTVGTANNLINNIPLGLIAGASMHASHFQGLIANAVLIGVDLGPNLSVTGSLATILWLLALRKEKLHVTAWDFLKAGVIAMPTAMIASVAGLLLAQKLMHL